LLFASCSNNHKRDNTEIDLSIEEAIIVHEKLDSNLVKGVLELIEIGNSMGYPEIPLEESFIIMLFCIDKQSTDSVVAILHYNYFFAIDNELAEYQGVLNIEGYNIAIFEATQNSNGFGHNFYNTDSLRQISLENFKRYPIKNFREAKFQVRNDSLIYLGNWLVIRDPPSLPGYKNAFSQ
jgi:hypothetical protein